MRRLRAALLVCCVAAGCSSAPTGKLSDSPPDPPSLAVPMETSVQTGSGAVWATMPMGKLDEPLNTFWQLLYEPAPGGTWSDRVEATATATNGGLVLAPAPPSGIVVGIRPSDLLQFTPLIESATGSGSGSWRSGLIDTGLSARPAALAFDPHGAGGLALVKNALLASSGDISTWRHLLDPGALAAMPAGRACQPADLTAVAFLAGSPVVGASCRRGGTVGLFERSSGAWIAANPPGPVPGRAEVVYLHGASDLAVVAAATAGGGTRLLAYSAHVSNGRLTWVASPPLPVPNGFALGSLGPAGAGGTFALLSGPAGQRLYLWAPGSTWTALPDPPPGTGTAVLPLGAAAQVLAARGDDLSVWSLDATGQRWVRAQELHVDIQYGSSS